MWRVEHHDVVDSTMTTARDLPAWSAVVADVQTAGRGQAERTFVSDRGGVYLTAVLPYGDDPLASRGFALAVGWAMHSALTARGVRGLRLKWPNDLMIGARKVGGILTEQGARNTLLVGVGVNLSNRPWEIARELAGVAGSLNEEWSAAAKPLERDEGVTLVLDAIARAHEVFARVRLAGLAHRLNACWGGLREVELDLATHAAGARGAQDATCARGIFLGIDADGALQLLTSEGESLVVAAHRVERLREV